VNDTTSASAPTVLRLTGLPDHSRLDLDFLFAALDSWDTGSAGFDFFNVIIDGVLVFHENFGHGNTPGNIGQEYEPSPGVQLLNRPFTNRAGDTSPDSAWDLGRDPAFNSIAHSASTVTIQWFADGCCWSGGADESWAIDNVMVTVDSDATAGNIVSGNYIGTDITGAAALGNGAHGVSLAPGAQGNRVGLSTPGGRNILSGNTYSGVGVFGAGTERNTIAGNFIGTNAAGSAAIGNQNFGVAVYEGARSNWIGTNGDSQNDADEGNIISGNMWSGVGITMVGTDRNHVSGNRIGTDASGSIALANLLDGVSIFNNARFNQIGTNGDTVSDAEERNIISGNSQTGVAINGVGTTRNSVAGNWVGTDATGTIKLGNHAWGVYIGSGASDNLLGTNGDGVSDVAERNLISGNAFCGVGITLEGTNRNVVSGNFIGVNLSGTAALGNDQCGIEISQAAQENRVGSDGNGIADEAERNIISGNGAPGVAIAGAGTQRNVVAGNYVGTDVSGQAALGNATDGVVVFAGAQNNRIGSDANGHGDAAERNVISANLANGVALFDANTTDNVVAGNLIGTNASGSQPLGNANNGVSLVGGTKNLIGGQTLASANRIAFNGQAGVIASSNATGNPIQGNAIFSNGGLGIDLLESTGVTANDSGDGDVGGNNLQNFPVLSAASVKRGKTKVRGSLQALPRGQYRVEFFSNGATDPSGFGEGEVFLGTTVVTVKKKGSATFSVSLNAALVPGQIITATATSVSGDTSEFSAPILVSGKEPRVAAFLDHDRRRDAAVNLSTSPQPPVVTPQLGSTRA
jgi:titin